MQAPQGLCVCTCMEHLRPELRLPACGCVCGCVCVRVHVCTWARVRVPLIHAYNYTTGRDVASTADSSAVGVLSW